MASEEFVTLDGSRILELIRPQREGSENLSLARATVMPGATTRWHRHSRSEEIYYVLRGAGLLAIEAQRHEVAAGDARLIPAGAEHRITCLGAEPLVILCACSPPYSDDDTQVTEPVPV